MYRCGIETSLSGTKSVTLLSINCTVVELKHDLCFITLIINNVLIVPLWNWNSGSSAVADWEISINCTVVELKRHSGMIPSFFFVLVLIVPLWNWNCIYVCFISRSVSLWNWNTFEVKVLRFVYDVLIVPLWNWNDWRGRFRWFGHGINCTVVELKPVSYAYL